MLVRLSSSLSVDLSHIVVIVCVLMMLSEMCIEERVVLKESFQSLVKPCLLI